MIRCIAIDDEPIALSILKEYCRRHGDMEIECFSSPVEGMEAVRTRIPDILFLDIEMRSHNGLELARILPEGVMLIFTTAYAEYALEGFNVNAVDFLHKPIFYPRFCQAIEKATGYMKKSLEPTDSESNSIILKADHQKVVVPLDSITHIEAMDNYVKIHRVDQPTVIPQITMKELLAMLPPDRFIRVHRSYIISVTKSTGSPTAESIFMEWTLPSPSDAPISTPSGISIPD